MPGKLAKMAARFSPRHAPLAPFHTPPKPVTAAHHPLRTHPAPQIKSPSGARRVPPAPFHTPHKLATTALAAQHTLRAQTPAAYFSTHAPFAPAPTTKLPSENTTDRNTPVPPPLLEKNFSASNISWAHIEEDPRVFHRINEHIIEIAIEQKLSPEILRLAYRIATNPGTVEQRRTLLQTQGLPPGIIRPLENIQFTGRALAECIRMIETLEKGSLDFKIPPHATAKKTPDATGQFLDAIKHLNAQTVSDLLNASYFDAPTINEALELLINTQSTTEPERRNRVSILKTLMRHYTPNDAIILRALEKITDTSCTTESEQNERTALATLLMKYLVFEYKPCLKLLNDPTLQPAILATLIRTQGTNAPDEKERLAVIKELIEKKELQTYLHTNGSMLLDALLESRRPYSPRPPISFSFNDSDAEIYFLLRRFTAPSLRNLHTLIRCDISLTDPNHFGAIIENMLASQPDLSTPHAQPTVTEIFKTLLFEITHNPAGRIEECITALRILSNKCNPQMLSVSIVLDDYKKVSEFLHRPDLYPVTITSIFDAIRHCSIDTFKLLFETYLLTHRKLPNALDDKLQTYSKIPNHPLMRTSTLAFAAHQGRTDCVKHLISLGADVTCKVVSEKRSDSFNFVSALTSTALHMAALHDDPELISTLVTAGINVDESQISIPTGNAPDNPANPPNGVTALHLSIMSGNAKSACALLMHGANPSLKNNLTFPAKDAFELAIDMHKEHPSDASLTLLKTLKTVATEQQLSAPLILLDRCINATSQHQAP